ncbi:hypothetical protein [Gordonia sp. 852002-51296_SCH5728562-b]|uniref:hypothetical protein n=1 Tax=Gordonia sp. 852002-51296_SCH5728562-b TaxID=1834101 RepID=UPI0007EB87EB|nr:hypothetical protein [Gordonia sp. 852002-51296_SCH5728562-b]OBA39003.1 hypothetical protein A5766_04415 [Gordonia sp. 852002-51296_SCH5728562-b]
MSDEEIVHDVDGVPQSAAAVLARSDLAPGAIPVDLAPIVAALRPVLEAADEIRAVLGGDDVAVVVVEVAGALHVQRWRNDDTEKER